MLNHITIMGRLTRDPELRRTGQGTAVTSFTVAVDRDFSGKDGGEKKTDFFDCVAWRNTAEFASKYLTKGRMVVVSGRLEFRDWNDKEGNKRRSAEVIVDNVYFADSKPEGSSHGGGSYGSTATGGSYHAPAATDRNAGYGNNYGGYSAPAAPAPPAGGFGMLEDDDAQLPF